MGAQTGYSLPPNQFTMGALGSLGADSSLWCVLQDNATKDITPKATGKLNPDYYTFTANQQKYYFVSRCEAARQDLARTNVGVGELVSLYFSQTAPDNIPVPAGCLLSAPITWQTTAGSFIIGTGGAVLIAPSNAAIATVTATVRGASVSNCFNVLEPTGISSTVRSNQIFSAGQVGAGMYLNVVLQPTNVSFGRLEMTEPAEATTGITGYFTTHTPPTHAGNGAGDWHSVNSDNLVVDNVFDHAWSGGWPIGVWGSYTWPISPVWTVGYNGNTNSLNGWTDQVMTLSTDGTMRVDKLDHYVIRHP